MRDEAVRWRGFALMADIVCEKGEVDDSKKMKKCERGVRAATFQDSFWKRKGDEGGKT